MSDAHKPIAEERLYDFEPLDMAIDDLPLPGLVLDIGGGGEGVIGRLKGAQVVAIDRNRRELEETPAGPLRIVMDATDLHFLDGTFSAATSFFSLMYIQGADHSRVFGEVYRVLAPGGRFLIWDAVFPPREDTSKDVAVFQLTIRLPQETITTGYGVKWPESGRSLDDYLRVAEEAGFQVVSHKRDGVSLFLELIKPQTEGQATIKTSRRVQLVPMDEAALQRYLEHAIPNYAQEHVRAGNWNPEEALEKAEKAFRELLADGTSTKDQYLYSILDEERATIVGMIWFGVFQRAQPQGYILDFLIDEAFRGQGYGAAALQAAETQIRALGLTRVALHVFGHNHVARALYEKMGYHATDLSMAKEL
jgi:RimJ/RimL family protein N-acetyltransferase